MEQGEGKGGDFTRTASNDAYAFTSYANGSVAGTSNGLNQLTSVGAKSVSHDSRGNVTALGSDTYAYSSENLLASASVGGVTTNLGYDPLLRLIQVPGAVYTSQFAYDGLDLIAEYYSGVLVGRHVFDPTTDQPLVTYLDGGTSRVFLSPDERGSVLANTNNAGVLIYGNAYDEYGSRMPWDHYRFQYTGQAWIAEIGLYYYKARMYSAELGRFLQTDPIGYADSPNLYAYVLNDPVNLVDPLGLCGVTQTNEGIIITKCLSSESGGGSVTDTPRGGFWGSYNGAFNPGGPNEQPDRQRPAPEEEIVVTGTRPAQSISIRIGTQVAQPLSIVWRPGPLAHAAAAPTGNYCTGVPDQPMGADISEACRRHDECYAPVSGLPRSECDARLGQDIYEACRRQGADQGTCFALAETYYLGVRAFGTPFYYLPRVWRRRGIQ